jgi:hypothetical protein
MVAQPVAAGRLIPFITVELGNVDSLAEMLEPGACGVSHRSHCALHERRWPTHANAQCSRGSPPDTVPTSAQFTDTAASEGF